MNEGLQIVEPRLVIVHISPVAEGVEKGGGIGKHREPSPVFTENRPLVLGELLALL